MKKKKFSNYHLVEAIEKLEEGEEFDLDDTNSRAMLIKWLNELVASRVAITISHEATAKVYR
jgi:hypothetical protein